MKRRIIFSLLIIATLLLNIIPVHAAINPANPEDPLGIGINPSNIPQTPEDAANVSLTYLQKEWTKIVQDKTPFLWTIHQFLLSHQMLFNVILNKEYSFTATFFLALALWFYLASLGANIFDSLGFIKQKIGIIMGILFAVILAQVNFINWVSNGAVYLVNANEARWMRAIIWIVIIILFVFFIYLRKTLGKYFEASKKAEKERELEEEVEKEKGFRKGFKEMYKSVKE